MPPPPLLPPPPLEPPPPLLPPPPVEPPPPLDGLLIVIERLLELLPAVFVAVTVNVLVAAVVGVPLITPVLALSDNPAGSEPLVMLHVIGAVPVAASVLL